MLQTLKRVGLLVLVGGAVFTLDQVAKRLVVEQLELGQSWVPIPAIGGFIRVTRSYNTGAAFGMFPWAADFFLGLALITILVFILSYPRLPSHAWLSRVSIALISGGALSNAIDRIRLGHVVDYVHVQLTPGFANISNFADHAITVGTALLLIDQWIAERREAREREREKARLEQEQNIVTYVDQLLAQEDEMHTAPVGEASADNPVRATQSAPLEKQDQD